MHKVKQVKTIEVKRAFLIADFVRKSDKNKKGYLQEINEKEFLVKLKLAKREILALSEEKLDEMIASTYPKRLMAYDSSNWYIGTFVPSEVGVWRRAGQLPLEWTNGTLKETAEHVAKALVEKSKKLKHRAKFAIPNILKTNVDIVQKEIYLLPIVFKGGTGTKGRKYLKRKTKGDIDDGCMRSIALAVKGAVVIKAYIGFPKKID